MSTIKEYSIKGVRDIRQVKGCNDCLSCRHIAGTSFSKYACKVRGKSTLNDRKFPYDNTKCKEYRPKDAES